MAGIYPNLFIIPGKDLLVSTPVFSQLVFILGQLGK